jgi:hypothetical protein
MVRGGVVGGELADGARQVVLVYAVPGARGLRDGIET